MKKGKISGRYFNAINEVFKSKNYWIIFIISSVIMFLFYVYIPIYITPGNDLKFFMQITPWWGLLILILLSLLMGLLVCMQVYIYKHLKKVPLKEGGSGIVAWLSSVISGLFSSATCASCVSVLFAFLGTGGILFLLKYRWHISGIGLILVLFSINLSIKRINNHCESCGKVCKK